MSLRLILAATASLALAAPAFAQDAPATPPPPATSKEAKSPDVLAFETRSEAFGARLDQFQTELEAAISAAGGDQAKGMAEIEIIIARYEPEIDAFVPELEAFFDSQIAVAANDAEREALTTAKTSNSTGLRGMANHVRTVSPQFITAAAAAPAPSSGAS